MQGGDLFERVKRGRDVLDFEIQIAGPDDLLVGFQVSSISRGICRNNGGDRIRDIPGRDS